MKIILCISLLMIIGCVRNVDKMSHSLLLSDSDRKILNQHCYDLEQVGNIQDYLKLIDIEMKIIFKLIEEDNGSVAHYDKIMEKAGNVSDAIVKIEALIDSDYNTPKWDYEVTWKITKEDFKKFIGNYLPGGFDMTWIKPHSAYIFGERDDGLLDNLNFRFGKKTANFTYKNKGTTLEICQLGKTRMLLMEIHYRHLGNNNKRYFNLINR